MKKQDHSVVAMMDLLGFSQIIEQDSLDEVERRYTTTLMSGLTMAGFSSIGAFVFDEHGNLDAGEDLWSVSFGVFSDTIVMWPKPLLGGSLHYTCKVVALLIDIALQGDWLFRGGIEFGAFRALREHNLYIGKGLVDAHRLESSQNWAGAIVGPQAQAKYVRDIDEMRSKHLLVQYAVPIKKDNRIIRRSCLAVNWCYFDMGWQRDRRKILDKLLVDAPRSAKAKIRATIRFHDAMVKAGYASIEQIAGRVYGDPTGGKEDITDC